MVKRINRMHKLVERFGKGRGVKSGVLSDATYPNGESIAKIAFWNEYGTKSAPPRPFFRNAINENKDKWRSTLTQALKHGLDTEKALALTGEQISNDLRESIISGSFEPNSPVTLLLKERFPRNPEDVQLKDLLQAIQDVENGVSASGSKDKPLQWSGDMLRSISYEVDDES